MLSDPRAGRHCGSVAPISDHGPSPTLSFPANEPVYSIVQVPTAAGVAFMVEAGLVFELRRPVAVLYSGLLLVLSAALLLLSLGRGVGELCLWSVAYLGVVLLSSRVPNAAPLAAGFLAFLLGFVRTYHAGYNLDLGLGLVALAIGLYALRRAYGPARRLTVDLAGLSLLAIAAWSLISLVFAIVRIRSFVPAPDFAYHSYQFNPAGFSAEEAVVRAFIGATASFAWFGLYEYARSARLRREVFNVAVFLALLANAAVLLVQQYADPGFLLPADMPPSTRLNGVTSFCYALGDSALALFLLLPAWGARHGVYALLTAGSVGLLTYAAVASGSRTALLTMLFATLAWAGLRVLRLSRARRRLAALLVLVGAALLLGLTATAYRLTPADRESPLGRLKKGIEQDGLLGHLVDQRLAAHPLLLRVMQEYPLSGVGAGLFLAEAEKQHALLAPDLRLKEPYLLASFAPNQFLNTGVELGAPALVGLVIVFVHAALVLFRRRREGVADRAVSLLALAAALQLGPAFYNSEALVFLWLIIGLAARGGSSAEESVEPPSHPWRVRSGATAALLAAAALLGVVGQLLACPSLALEHQWAQLRWRLGMGMLRAEPPGRWSRPEATFSLDANAPAVIVRWHVGDEASPDYGARVSFYVDGTLVEESLARSGAIRETVLPLPAVPGFKRISVRVVPPFVPAAHSGSEDRRRLGVFVHSVTPVARPAASP